MGYDLMRAVEEAWGRVGPGVEGDAVELARRKARRRMGVMLRAPRAWCLVVRACDTRMTPGRVAMVPDRPVWWDREERRWRYVEHEVVLEERELRRLCRPVSIPRPGVDAAELARMLGVDPMAVWRMGRRGGLSVRYIKGLGGKWGKPVPVVYTNQLLNPAGIPLGRMGDELWGTTWRFVADHIPKGLTQTLVRRPVWRPWRGQEKFRGWRWVCPGCGREVMRVFYPLSGLMMGSFVKREKAGSADAWEGSPGCFACERCHQVHDYGRLAGQGWNELVAHLSGGLLYGHEVEKPPGYGPVRKRAYRKLTGRAKSKREGQITGFLVDTELSSPQIAKRLGLAVGTVRGWMGRIYQRNGVHGREELRRKMAGVGVGRSAG